MMSRGLLTNHFDLQKGMFFSKKEEFISYEVFESDLIEDFFWNYSYIKENFIPENIIFEIETLFSSINRRPCIYLSGNQLCDNNIQLLAQHLYREEVIESWMVFDNNLSLESKHPVVRVTNNTEFIDFKNVFIKAYGGEKTPEQPYGELPESYIKCLNRSFYNFNNFYHFVLYEKGEPVSIATLCYKDGIGGIYSVGTDPAHRGNGFGSSITLACVKKWKELGGTLLLLQTESDSKVEQLYLKLGFNKIFTGKGFVKTE